MARGLSRTKASLTEPPERLQKLLSRLGLASRREAEQWIRTGRLTVNGEPATLGVRVRPTDKLQLDGRPIRQRLPATSGSANRKPAVFLCHRSTGDPITAVVERIPHRAGSRFVTVSPMPRIDGGLELITADGELAARLQRMAHRLTSEFSVRIRGELATEALQGILDGALDRGVRLDVESCEPGGGEGTNRWYTLIARGGSGKDVRQLFERQGALVSRVLRTRLGPLNLNRNLGRGHYRELDENELSALLAAAPRSSGP